MKICLGDPGPTRLGRQAREALAAHELLPLESEGRGADLILLFSTQLGKLPRWLPDAPCPSLLLVSPRDRLRLAPLPVDAVRPAPAGYEPELHFKLEPPVFERDFGHPGPPPDDLRAQCQAASMGSALFAAGLNDAARADFLRGTRITLTDEPELAMQALACGSLPLRSPQVLSEDERLSRLSGLRPVSWREAWDALLSKLPTRGPRRSGRWWWERHVYRSERRTQFGEALAGLKGPRAQNLRGCLLATMADYEPVAEKQAALRDEALECFQRSLGLGRLAYLNLGQLHLRRGESEEAVTLLAEAVQPDQPFHAGEFYPRVSNVFLRRWHRFPAQREKLVLWKAWLLMAEHCPPFGHLMSQQAVQALPQPAEGHWQRALRIREPLPQLRALDRVLRRQPLKLEARLVRIRKLWELGRKLEASREYHAARDLLRAFPYLEREPRDLERLWLEVTTRP